MAKAKKRPARRKTSTARRAPARRTAARRKAPARKTAARRRAPARRAATRRRAPARKSTTARRAATAHTSTHAHAAPKPSPKKDDLAAMYLSILIVGIAGIILLFANPTDMMRKVIGVLLVILGVWGLMAKK